VWEMGCGDRKSGARLSCAGWHAPSQSLWAYVNVRVSVCKCMCVFLSCLLALGLGLACLHSVAYLSDTTVSLPCNSRGSKALTCVGSISEPRHCCATQNAGIEQRCWQGSFELAASGFIQDQWIDQSSIISAIHSHGPFVLHL